MHTRNTGIAFIHVGNMIFCHSDLDLRHKVTNYSKVRASAVSNRLAKIVSKSVHLFDQQFVHRCTDTQTYISISIDLKNSKPVLVGLRDLDYLRESVARDMTSYFSL